MQLFHCLTRRSIKASVPTTFARRMVCVVAILALFAPTVLAPRGIISEVLVPSALAQTKAPLVLGADDVIAITVTNHPDLNQTITIRPDGKITVPRAGDVQAAGRTSQALAADIEKRLSRTLNNARVMVAIKEVHSLRVRVVGAVAKAGSYELKPNWHFMDIVLQAGGLATKPTRITGRIIRDRNVISLNVERAALQPEGPANVLLQPNDLIVLDQRDIFKQVNVIGQVGKPGAYDLTEDLSVMTLLNDAGGATEQAALRKAYVQRAGRQISLDLYSLLVERRTDALAAKFKFELGDVVVVPENEARFSVMGQVTKPGFYLLPEKREEATALKALTTAGNVLPGADLRNVSITRTTNGQPREFSIDLASQLTGQKPDSVVLEPGDIIHVPQRQVHVIGRVGKPGAYDISDELNAISLISLAGNAAEGAGLSKAYVLRQGNQLPLNLHKVLVAGQSDATVTDFKFQNGDVLVVPDIQDQISVIGKVGRPGTYNLDDDLTVISLMLNAGGVAEGASLRRAHVLRSGNPIPLDLYSTMIEGKSDKAVSEFKFQVGDVLVVPENPLRYAVMGAVGRPGYYPVPEKKGEATVLKALSSAGGAGQADLKNAGIIRTVNGQPTRIALNIDQMLKQGDLSTNVQLQHEDVLYIPAKGASTSIWSRILGALPIIGMFGGF